jgi:hypothetical protein
MFFFFFTKERHANTLTIIKGVWVGGGSYPFP